MIERIFGALFLAALVIPVLAVVVGAAGLLWPRKTMTPRVRLHHQPEGAYARR